MITIASNRSIAAIIAVAGSVLMASACDRPLGYAVMLTAVLDDSVPSEAVASVARLDIDVSGDESFADTLPLGALPRDRQIRVVYRPNPATSGRLHISLRAVDDDGALVARGAGDVDLRAGAPSELTIFLSRATDQNPETPDLGEPEARPKATGEPCVDGRDRCASGFCVDGICCDSACTDACNACNLRDFRGICTPIPDGEAPVHSSCPALSADDLNRPCGTDGTCDGQGACRLYPINTECSRPRCDPQTNLFTPPSVCDGAGRCIAVPASTCAPYVCDGAVCHDRCTTTADCAAPSSCENGSCGKLNNGRTCENDNQCVSGICVDGVCCNARCQGQCEACNADSTHLGECRPVVGAPHLGNGRTACVGAGSSCGGACDGTLRTACVYPATSVSCRAQSCAVDAGVATLTQPARCDGAGHCPLVKASCQSTAPSNTAPRCVGNACDYSQCVSGFANCDSSPGCETNLNNDNQNCGQCRRSCSSVLVASACVAGTCTCTTAGAVACDSSSPPECYVPSRTRCCRPNGDHSCGCDLTRAECVETTCPPVGCICVKWKYVYTCRTGDCGHDFIDDRFDSTGQHCRATRCNADGSSVMECDIDAR